jgi:hypothetical protein
MSFVLRVEYSEVEELIRDKYRDTIIKLKDGGEIKLTGEEAKRAYKKLCRNFEGEHLD